MRRIPTIILVFLSIVSAAFGQTATGSVSYETPERGGMVIETAGGTDALVVGYARLQPSVSTTPSGVAIFSLSQDGVLVTEAGVPAGGTMLSGRTYAEVNGALNTGFAFLNPNTLSVTVAFRFTDQNGNDIEQGSFVLAGNAQLAKFLDQAPFNATGSFAGSFTFSATGPVAVIALRTLVNERGEFLITTQSVISLADSINSNPLVLGHFVDGGGWKTQVILINTVDTAVSGTVQFFDEGTASLPARPLTMNVNGQVAASFDYNIRPRSSIKLETSGPAGTVEKLGSVRVTPASSSNAPSGFAVFSFSRSGVTLSMATVPSEPPAIALRTYVEVSSSTPEPGAIQSALAITNTSPFAAAVNFDLTSLSGTNLGVGASVLVPAFGHVSRFIHELFPAVAFPFRGLARITSANLIQVVNLRTRYNERGDFLVTTVPVTNEASLSSTAESFFPHIVDRGGYTTQFVLFSGIARQSTMGNLSFFSQSGEALEVNVVNVVNVR